MIGQSDGTQYNSEFEAELGPINTDPSTPARRAVGATEKPAGEFKSAGGTGVPQTLNIPDSIVDSKDWDGLESMVDKFIKDKGFKKDDEFDIQSKSFEEPGNSPWHFKYLGPNSGGRKDWMRVEPPKEGVPTSEIDRDHHVPLIAAKTPNGIAVDHRVNLAMNFEGKDHDITPFLIAHENAEIDPMESAIKGGMEPKKAYELAHDKVANPAEAAVRNAYAISNGLDVDKFNEAYWSHINTQKEIAAQPSDQPRHPDAHTTRYGLDPNTKVAMDMEDTPGYLLRHGGQDDTQFGMVAGRSFKGPMIQPKPANENDPNFNKVTEEQFERLRDRLLGPVSRGTIPKDVMTSMKGLDNLGFDRPSDALNAIRDDIERGADPKKNWDIRPEDELMWKRVMDYIREKPTKPISTAEPEVIKGPWKDPEHKPAADQLREWWKDKNYIDLKNELDKDK